MIDTSVGAADLREDVQIRRAKAGDRDGLFDIWPRAVRATHTFVSQADIESFMPLVRDYLASSETECRVLCNSYGTVMGFMGMAGPKMEALFLAPHSTDVADHLELRITTSWSYSALSRERQQQMCLHRAEHSRGRVFSEGGCRKAANAPLPPGCSLPFLPAGSDVAVQQRMSGALLLRADVTANSAQDRALLRRFRLFGPPATIFLRPRRARGRHGPL